MAEACEKLPRIESQLLEYLGVRLCRSHREQTFQIFDQLSFLHAPFRRGD